MIYIRESDLATFTVDSTHCDGSQATVISETQCSIPISTLRAGAFQLPWGSSIYAKVHAYNLYGSSAASGLGNGAVILTNPDAPSNVREDEDQRSSNSITIIWDEGASNGGATILDYRVSYDQSINDFIVLAEGVTQRSFTAITLSSGITYTFKVEARNTFGYSEFSDQVPVLCATIPSKPATPYSYRDGGDVIIAWVTPRINGLEITSYSVMIQAKDGTFHTEPVSCDGSDSTIVSNVQCAVPLTTVIAEPFNLLEDDQVYVKITASNAYGTSEESNVGSGAIVKLVPDSPLTL